MHSNFARRPGNSLIASTDNVHSVHPSRSSDEWRDKPCSGCRQPTSRNLPSSYWCPSERNRTVPRSPPTPLASRSSGQSPGNRIRGGSAAREHQIQAVQCLVGERRRPIVSVSGDSSQSTNARSVCPRPAGTCGTSACSRTQSHPRHSHRVPLGQRLTLPCAHQESRSHFPIRAVSTLGVLLPGLCGARHADHSCGCRR